MEENKSLKRFTEVLFGDLFSRQDITEIVINKIGQIFYEDDSGFHKGTNAECERVTFENVTNFSNAVASASKQQLTTASPILGTTLQNDERIQIVIPPA